MDLSTSSMLNNNNNNNNSNSNSNNNNDFILYRVSMFAHLLCLLPLQLVNRPDTRDKGTLAKILDRSWCFRHTSLKLILVVVHGSMDNRIICKISVLTKWSTKEVILFQAHIWRGTNSGDCTFGTDIIKFVTRGLYHLFMSVLTTKPIELRCLRSLFTHRWVSYCFLYRMPLMSHKVVTILHIRNISNILIGFHNVSFWTVKLILGLGNPPITCIYNSFRKQKLFICNLINTVILLWTLYYTKRRNWFHECLVMLEIFTELPLKIYKFWFLYRQAVRNSLKQLISLVLTIFRASSRFVFQFRNQFRCLV